MDGQPPGVMGIALVRLYSAIEVNPRAAGSVHSLLLTTGIVTRYISIFFHELARSVFHNAPFFRCDLRSRRRVDVATSPSQDQQFLRISDTVVHGFTRAMGSRSEGLRGTFEILGMGNDHVFFVRVCDGRTARWTRRRAVPFHPDWILHHASGRD